MKAFRVQIYLKGGRLSASFIKDGESAIKVMSDITLGFNSMMWQYVQTDSEKEAVILRITEIEAVTVNEIEGS
jgi:hypothetical protein